MAIESGDNMEIDMASALAEMDKEFGGGDEGQEGTPSPAAQEASTSPTSTPQAPAPEPQPWDAPPKSWKQELHPNWTKYDPQTRQYIHEREKQALEGIMRYKSAYDPYAKLEQQYKPYIERYKMPLPEVSNNLISAHLALMEGTPEVKQQVLESLFNYPGVRELLQTMMGGQAPQGEAPTTQQMSEQAVQQLVQQAVQRSVAPALSEVQAWRQAQEEAALQESQKVVDAFIADPQNEYAAEAMPDMVRLIKAGFATDLKTAYGDACNLNPTIRAKILEKEIQKATQRPAAAPRNVRSGQTPPASTKPVDADEDMEATMRRTYREIQSR